MTLETVLADLILLPKLALAVVLTGAIGWDRERKDRPAGLRTHMLVGVSACTFVMIGEMLTLHFAGLTEDGFRYDPIRIVEATVGGVSFLGAGSVLVRGDHVVGLTTAGSLLASAAVGIVVALEHYVLAAGITLMLLFIVATLSRLSRSSGNE